MLGTETDVADTAANWSSADRYISMTDAGAGGRCERANLDLTFTLLDILGKPRSLIRYVKDRPGHDRRYALDCRKARALGWRPARAFDDGLVETVRWYRANEPWWRPLKSGAFEAYYARQYAGLGHK